MCDSVKPVQKIEISIADRSDELNDERIRILRLLGRLLMMMTVENNGEHPSLLLPKCSTGKCIPDYIGWVDV